MAKLAVWEFFWGPETEYAYLFLHTIVYRVSLLFPMSITAIEPACFIFFGGGVGDVIPFRDAMHHKIFDQDTETTRHMFSIGRGIRW